MDDLESELRLPDFRVKGVTTALTLISKVWENPNDHQGTQINQDASVERIFLTPARSPHGTQCLSFLGV